jgi:hypothetical protein
MVTGRLELRDIPLVCRPTNKIFKHSALLNKLKLCKHNFRDVKFWRCTAFF